MEIDFTDNSDLKPEMEVTKTICRCCLTTDRRMKNAVRYNAYFNDLAGINVSESDGLPQWLCYECCALMLKAVRFKNKVLRANAVLFDYLIRCAPFPVDAQDAELSKYSAPTLSATPTLSVDFDGKTKTGFHKPLQHKKEKSTSVLDAVDACFIEERGESVKEELGFSDYEDNITLEEYRSNVTKLTEEDSKITEDDLEQLLKASESLMEDKTLVKEKKRKSKKDKEHKVKKKKNSSKKLNQDLAEPKTSIRKAVDVDPTKIKIVILNPDEQIKQREEESKMSLKYPYQCQLCYKGFNFEIKLQNHMNKHNPSRGQFECKLCSMYLPTSYSYSVHSLIHTRRYECLKCGRRMIDRASILDHYRTQHEGLLTLYTCHLCGKVSNNNKTHRGHMRNHHSGDRPKCQECGKTFVNKDSLAEHAQIHEGIKNYECHQCGKKFRTRTQIKHHQLTHSDVKEFYCVECDVRFKSAHSLRQHLLKSLKHKDKQSFKFPCTRCESRFQCARVLAAHVAVQHEGVRAHRCALCPAALASANSLHKHVQAVHRGQRPEPKHVCDACGKAFRGKSVLTNHVRTHTGEKPFECAQCGRKFTQRTAMRTHVKLVHLKIRRQAKLKPEASMEPKIDMFTKEEPSLVLDSWGRQPMQPCDVYFTVTAGS